MLCSAALLVGCLVLQPGPAPLADDEPFGCAHAKTATRLLAFERGGGGPLAASAGDTDVQHYHLDIEIDPVNEWIGGSNTMTVRCLVDGLSEFNFRLKDNLTISDVQVGGGGAAWSRLDEATIEVTLDRAYDADEVFEVYVAYSGFPDGGGFGSIVFRSRGGAREVWTLSEPWFAYSWWPAKDDNTDKTTADLWFTVPDSMVVASNGLLQGVDPVGGDQLRYRWQTLYETADYLYCIGATNYDRFGDTWSYDGWEMPLDFYIYPEDNNSGNRDAWLENRDMLDVFSDRYGIYPFVEEKYGMCQVGFGGGMEHQTMTSQGGFWESITAHELAHQWYGDMITCATWHDIWLNEGFATFSEAIWWGDRPGGTMQDYHARMDARRPNRVDGSVYCYDISSVNRIFSGDFTYRKAAWVIHMLRHAVGDETFFEILAQYRDAYEYDSATTEDFQLVCEGVSGRDLAWFFDEWVYEIGAPAYRSAWRSHEIDGRTFVELYLDQVQNSSYPIFTMPLDVVTDGSGGEAVATVWNDAETEHLLFEVPGTVSSLALDPEDWTLHTSNSSTSFVEGPPKVVVTAPAPGAEVESAAEFTVEITLHKDVVSGPDDFALVGDMAGAIPFTFEYDAADHRVTLTTAAPPPDDYTLTVHDSVVDVAAGLALDGEVGDPDDPAALPSGDGLPGVDAVIRFTVTVGDLPGDVNGDGRVDFEDILRILGAWGPCEDCPEDLDGSGVVDFADILIVLANWG